ncbi:MAG: hypothetical protein Q7T11_07040 [Deltaproteobacteria bacterium]|nr:hypothetical protein [Deltaproteobacteria bacterium]
MPERKRIFSFIVLFFLAQCSGVGTTSGTGGIGGDSGGDSGTGEDGGSSDSGADGSPLDETTSDSLYSSGPVDVPVPIAKVEAIDPKYVVVAIDGKKLTLTGQAGAVPNPTLSPKVWARDTDLAETVTTDTKSDGSFDAISFTYSSSSFEASIALAGYDGTSIGEPIFLKISEGNYIWVLTNGSCVSTSALTMSENRVYLVLNSDAGCSVTANRSLTRNQSSETSSDLYTLDIAGISEKVATTTSFTIDQVFADDETVVVRGGNTFYTLDGSGGFTECCSIDSSETIARVEVEADGSDVPWIAVVSDRTASICSPSLGECETQVSLASNETVLSMAWNETAGMDMGGYSGTIALRTVVTSGSTRTYKTYTYNRETDALTTTSSSGSSGGWQEVGTVSLMKDDLTITLNTTDATEGVSAFSLRPQTQVGSCTLGSETKKLMAVWTSYSSNYLLDASLNIRSSDNMLCSITKTRELYYAEIHPSAKLVFFCAEDSTGNGQFYAYIPELAVSSRTLDGTEIVQLTEGEEHCTRDKNWKVDPEEGTTDAPAGSLVIVDASNPLLPQIRFFDPATDERLAPYMD